MIDFQEIDTLPEVETLGASDVLPVVIHSDAQSYKLGKVTAANIAAAAFAGVQSANITDASIAHALNSTFSDVEVENALNALGVKTNLILDALIAAGIVAAA